MVISTAGAYNDDVIVVVSFQVVELRYIRSRDEQLKILRACHVDPTAGHMGQKKTMCRISERFLWPGIVKDVKKVVLS